MVVYLVFKSSFKNSLKLVKNLA